jgi:hypothetical protein
MNDSFCLRHMLAKPVECHYERRVFADSDPRAFDQYASQRRIASVGDAGGVVLFTAGVRNWG